MVQLKIGFWVSLIFPRQPNEGKIFTFLSFSSSFHLLFLGSFLDINSTLSSKVSVHNFNF